MKSVNKIIEFAKKYDVLVDVHVDEIDDEQSGFIEVLVARAYEYKRGNKSLAPFGIMGLVFDTISTSGIESLFSYGQLITFIGTRPNTYPLIFKFLEDSRLTEFFTRSSATNIPVNMSLCKKLGLDKDTYSMPILLVPLICLLFGIPDEITMKVIGVGFIVGVIQDSCGTALNSSTNVLYTEVAELSKKRKDKN